MTHFMAAAHASQLNIQSNKVAYNFYEAKASLAGEDLIDISLLINLDKAAQVAIARSFFFNRIQDKKLANDINLLANSELVEFVEVTNHGAFGVYLNIKVKDCNEVGVGINFEDRCACCYGKHKGNIYESGQWDNDMDNDFNYANIEDTNELLLKITDFYNKHKPINRQELRFIESLGSSEDFRVSFNIWQHETTNVVYVSTFYEGADDSCDPDATDISYDEMLNLEFASVELAKEFINSNY